MIEQCINGHQYTPENIYKNGSGMYRCKQCRLEYDLRHRAINSYRSKIWRIKPRNKAIEKKRIADKLAYVRSKKVSCSTCGESHPACLDFHHRDRSQKKFQLTAHKIGNYSMEMINKEIAKCDVLCSNCHRKLHYNERVG